MSDADLLALAAEAGLSHHWRDAFGQDQQVELTSLQTVLERLGLPASSPAQIKESRRSLGADQDGLPPLLTAVQLWAGPYGSAHRLW